MNDDIKKEERVITDHIMVAENGDVIRCINFPDSVFKNGNINRTEKNNKREIKSE